MKKKIYNEIKTPYQKLISLPNYTQYLHTKKTAQLLEEKAFNMNHIECLERLEKEKNLLFSVVFGK